MDTNNKNVKCCSKCGEIKENDKFIKNRNTCKLCHNANARKNYKENLSKNCKIMKPQIEQHMKYLSEYHTENNIEFPKIFIDLFAKYLVAGSPLEPMLSNK